VRATDADVTAARRDLGLEVTRAFWAVVTAQASVGVLEESLARMEASLTDVRNRLAVGLVPPNDVLSIEAQRSRQQMLLIRARNTLEQTRSDLRYLTGQAPDAPIEIAARLELPRAPAATTDALLADALARRPERGAIEARIEGTAERLRATLANRRPVLGVGAGVDYARPNTRIFPRAAEWKPSWDVSVNLSWTLWDGGKVKAEAAEVTAAQRAARERLAEFDTRLGADIQRSRLDVDSAYAAVTATDDAVRAATEARRVVGERFDAGVATSTDVLDAQVALLQANLDRTQALAVVRLAEARLDWALGR
jgi:outer membrane protein TolC